MDDESFNMSMRKFLKRVGVTSQQAIEEAVRRALEEGTLPDGPLEVRTRIEIPAVGLVHQVEGRIATAPEREEER